MAAADSSADCQRRSVGSNEREEAAKPSEQVSGTVTVEQRWKPRHAVCGNNSNYNGTRSEGS